MSNFSFRPAVRENVGIIIGLSGPSGGGKTFSAMRLAAGIAEFRKEQGFSLLDSENKRGLLYASKFTFHHVPLNAPFEPKLYGQKMEEEDKAGSPAIIIDSLSHEWNGDGGILDWQEKEFERLGRKDNVKMLSWVAPKKAHKQLVVRMLQVNAFLIPCLRAEPKIEMKKNPKTGKMEVMEKKISQVSYGGYVPICEKNFPYELTVSFMLMPDRPGYPNLIKPLPEELQPIFPLDKPLDEEAGYKIAEWAGGGVMPTSPAASTPEKPASPGPPADPAAPQSGGRILGTMTEQMSGEVLAFMAKEDLKPAEMLEVVQTIFEQENIQSSKQLTPLHYGKLKMKFDKMTHGEVKLVKDNGPIHFEAVVKDEGF